MAVHSFLRVTFLSILLCILALEVRPSSNIILCGGSPGGLWSLLGAGLNSAVQKLDPSSTVTYQTSSGGFANIVQTKSGNCDVSIAHLGEIVIAKKGEFPFKESVPGLVAIALLYDWAPMQWIIDKKFAEDNEINDIADLDNVPVDLVVNKKGILPSILAEEALKLSGISFPSIIANGGTIQYQGSSTASQIMQDRKADVWVNATFVGSGKIRAISKSREVTLLRTNSSVIESMVSSYGSKKVVIPAAAYKWLDKDVQTFGAQAALIATSESNKDKVILIAKAIISYPEEIRKVHKAMGAFTLDLASSIGVIKYHESVKGLY
jgi:TRAP transporter TAXI family solute receptor